MTKSMTHQWFPIKVTPFLFLLATLPLRGEDPPPAQPAETPSVHELQPGTQPLTTPPPAGQTSTVQQGQAPQQLLSISPTNDAARYLAGLPLAPGSKLAALTQDQNWQAH